MENKVIKYVSMIPKEGFEQKEITFKKYEFGGLAPGHGIASKTPDLTSEVKLEAIQAKYKFKKRKNYEDWDYYQQKIEQSKLVDLPPNAYLEFAKCYENHVIMPDTQGTLAWHFTKKYGVLGSAGAGLHGHETLYKRNPMFSFETIAIDRFMEEAKEMYMALFLIAKEGKVSNLKYLTEEGKNIGVQVAVEKHKGKYQVVYLPNNLSCALWLQFFNAISSERVATHAICPWCKTIFQQGRADQQFCSRSHKTQYNRKFPKKGGKK